jgi:hypothetical protein
MEDEMEDENEMYGLESDYLPEEEEAVDTVAQSPLSIVRQRVLDTITKSEEEARGYQDTLNRIEEAKQRLLAAPDKRQVLQGLVSKLTTPREQTDPRFYERRNLFTFLRDVGEYGQEQRDAEKERQAKLVALQEMQAKYGMERAEKRGNLARQLAAQYLSKEPTARDTRTADIKNAESMGMTLKDYLAYKASLTNRESDTSDIRNAAAMGMSLKDYLVFKEGLGRKPEADPDKPATTVINRVSGVVNRDLSPVGARLGALNETRAAIANARTNPAQVPQVDRFFARLSGDSQLSQLEVNAVANSGAFPARIANQVSKFLTGSPTDLSLDQKAEVLDVLEDVLAPSFNSKRNQILNQFSVASDISPEAVEKIVGPRYMTAKEKRRLAEEKKAREEAEAKARADSVSTSTGKTGRRVD